MKSFTCFGKIIAGSVEVWHDLSLFEGKDVEVIIFTSRSSKQNRYYWKYLRKISESTGHSPQELHTEFKKILPEGKKSTAELSQDEFSLYLQDIQSKCSIPFPPSQLDMEEEDL